VHRKVKFDWPFKKDVSSAKLSADNVWVPTSFTRGDAEADEQYIEASLEDDAFVPEGSECISLEVDGNQEEFYVCEKLSDI
jgi:hypothetical protein